ncbi:hypothetical protein HDU97_009455 [Phlyctochytrium planicorne]|nr:hypothetical protein HDU97_009455 [Phlyctochytrium planicorne]
MEAYALIVLGTKRLEAIRRERLLREQFPAAMKTGSPLLRREFSMPSSNPVPEKARIGSAGMDHDAIHGTSPNDQPTNDSIPAIIQECFSKAIKLAPYISKAYIARAQAYLMLGYVRSARADANVAAELQPGSIVIRDLLRRVEDLESCMGMSEAHGTEQPTQIPSFRVPTQADVVTACVQSLDCTLCFSMIQDPVTSPCGHTWCRGCLLQSLSHATSCPLCRRNLPPYTYFERRPRNRILHSLIEFVQTVFKSFPSQSPTLAVMPNFPINNTPESLLESAPVTNTKTLMVPIFVGPLVFPGIPCYMHIFEPRYRGMLKRLMDEGQMTFGLCLPEPETLSKDSERGASSTSSSQAFLSYSMGTSMEEETDHMDVDGDTASGVPFPSSATVGICTGGSCQRYLGVGTLLRIRSCEPIQDSSDPSGELPRFFLDAVGESRFRVLKRGLSDGGYNVALVERVEDVELDDEENQPQSAGPIGERSDRRESEDISTSTFGGRIGGILMERRPASHSGVLSLPGQREGSSGWSPGSRQGGAGDQDPNDFDCPVTAYFNMNFRVPSRPSLLLGSHSSPTLSASEHIPSGSMDYSVGTNPPGKESSFLRVPQPFGTIAPSPLQTQNLSSPTSVLSSSQPSSPVFRRRRDPYSRLSTLRSKLLAILSALPPKAKLHLDLLNGPAPTDPGLLSFWLANMAPIGDYRKYQILMMTSVTERVEAIVELFEEDGVMERLEAMAAAMVSKSSSPSSAASSGGNQGASAAGSAGHSFSATPREILLACGCPQGNCHCQSGRATNPGFRFSHGTAAQHVRHDGSSSIHGHGHGYGHRRGDSFGTHAGAARNHHYRPAHQSAAAGTRLQDLVQSMGGRNDAGGHMEGLHGDNQCRMM